MNSLIIESFKQYDKVCLCGNDRNDSPGHSTRYCVYTLIEHTRKVVVDIPVVDKRETGGNSCHGERRPVMTS